MISVESNASNESMDMNPNVSPIRFSPGPGPAPGRGRRGLSDEARKLQRWRAQQLHEQQQQQRRVDQRQRELYMQQQQANRRASKNRPARIVGSRLGGKNEPPLYNTGNNNNNNENYNDGDHEMMGDPFNDSGVEDENDELE